MPGPIGSFFLVFKIEAPFEMLGTMGGSYIIFFKVMQKTRALSFAAWAPFYDNAQLSFSVPDSDWHSGTCCLTLCKMLFKYF